MSVRSSFSVVIFWIFIVVSVAVNSTDLSVLSVCTDWPKLKCEGGDLYVTLDYWAYSDDIEKSDKTKNQIKSQFYRTIDFWNKRSGLKYKIYWNIGGPGDEDKETAYKVYFQLRSLSQFIGKEGFVGSTLLYGFKNREWLAQGPLIIKKNNDYEESVKRFIECQVVEEFYAVSFEDYLSEKGTNRTDYCKYYFVGGR